MSAREAKALGLESLGWLSKGSPSRAAYYRGLYARASRLSAAWWLTRINWSISTIVTEVEEASPLSETVLTLKIEGE
jgi:hypothetical protein